MNRALHVMLFLWAANIAALAQHEPMSQAQAVQFQQEVLEASSKKKTMQSDFTQYKHMDFLANDIISSGTMMYRAPNTVRWAYTEPYEYSLVFIDGKMKVNDGGKKSEVDISSHTLLTKLNDLMMKSVRGDLFADPDFSVKYFIGAESDKMVMIPKDERIGEHISTFELFFSKDDRDIAELKMVEPNADFTRIVFNNRQLNPALGNEVFAD